MTATAFPARSFRDSSAGRSHIRRASVRGFRLRRNSAVWLALPLVLLVAMRGDTRDTAQYIDVFRNTTEFPWHPLVYYSESGMEWGYGLLSWILGGLGLGPISLFLFVSAGTFFFIERTARRLSLSFYAVMPYYLGSFFLTQQLMQIRQGLAIAFAFWLVVKVALDAKRPQWAIIGAAAAAMIHVVSVLPVVSALLLRPWLPASPTRRRIVVLALLLIVVCALLARAASSLELFGLFERLSFYAADEEYGSTRGLLDLANIRAAAMLSLLLAACANRALACSRAYVLLLGLYALHVGVRIGFLDFEILSGRLSTALGFAEVFLLPMTVRAYIRAPAWRTLVGMSYFLAQAMATLAIQTPFLIDDYFTPLYAYYAAR